MLKQSAFLSFAILLITQLGHAGTSSSYKDLFKVLEESAAQMRTPCQNELYRTTRINYMKGREDGTLEGQYCERMLLFSASDAFAEGHDLPADQLNVTIEPIRWKTEVPGHFDLLALDEINTQAASLWTKLVDCHRSPEKARFAYYKLDAKCGLDADVRNFSQSVHLFLESSLPFPVHFQLQGNYHPLLVQILLEKLSLSTWREEAGEKFSDVQVYSRAMIEYLGRGWTLEQIEEAQKDNNISTHATLLAALLEEKSVFPQYLRRLRHKFNAFRLLIHNTSLNKCESMGLWPGVSRAVAAGLDGDFVIRGLPLRKLQEKIYAACGDIHLTESPYSGNVKASSKIMKLFQERASRFEPKN